MRFLSATSVLALSLLSVLPVQAQTYEFKGQSTAVKAQMSITSLSSGQVVFTFKNVSNIESKLTGVGFDLDLGLNDGKFVKTSGPDAPFIFVDGTDQVPQFNDADLDFYLALGGDFNGGGSPRLGLSKGQASSSYTVFSFTNSFAGMSSGDLARGFYFRFKAIEGGGSDVAHRLSPPAVVAAIPEPSEYAFGGVFLTGLVGLLVRARRKHATPAAL
jgi:hypothetical protein